MMIFLTVGMHEQPLNRLVDLAARLPGAEVIVQYGFSKKPAGDVEAHQFLDFDAMKVLLDSADVVITHGGTGSIIMALSAGKKPIVVPRLAKYGEHVDDHQLEIVNELAGRGLILPYEDGADLDALVREAAASARGTGRGAETELCREIRKTLDGK